MQHLAMSGVRRWVLIDRETLEPENLVKHPGLRSDLGREKTAVAADWLRDRNPEVEVERMDVDVTHGEGRKAFEKTVQTADLLMVTTDNRQSRLVASRTKAPLAPKWWLAPRNWLGATYLYDAKTTGCYECLAQSEHVTVARPAVSGCRGRSAHPIARYAGRGCNMPLFWPTSRPFAPKPLVQGRAGQRCHGEDFIAAMKKEALPFLAQNCT